MQSHPPYSKNVHGETGLNIVKSFNEETISNKDIREDLTCNNKIVLYKLPNQNQRQAQNILTFPQVFTWFTHNPFAFKTKPIQFNPYVWVPIRKNIRKLSSVKKVYARSRFLNVNSIKTQMPRFGYVRLKKTDVVPYNYMPVFQKVFISNNLLKFLFNFHKYQPIL